MAAQRWTDAEGEHIDVRGLAPPLPLVEILSVIDRPGYRGPLIAHLERDPVFLYDELDTRGWTWEQLPSSADVVLRLAPAH